MNACLWQNFLESANQLGQLKNKAQIYKGLSSGTNKPDEGNRDKYDGTIQRSDHGSFQTQGYVAIIVSEDFLLILLLQNL